MSLMRRPVLQLNASYEALRIIPAMRALTLVTKGKATVELATNKLVYPGIYLPSVIRLLAYRHVPVRLQVTTRRNILMRDGYRCQYCGLKLHRDQATMDHVIPKVRGGPSSFTNCVAACKSCNGRKGEKTLDEAGLKLMKRPAHPSYFTAFYSMDKELQSNWHSDWNIYIRDQ